MTHFFLLAEAPESIGAALMAFAFFGSIAAYYISCEWRKVRQSQIDADLKREMIQKGLSTDEIVRVLKAGITPDSE